VLAGSSGPQPSMFAQTMEAASSEASALIARARFSFTSVSVWRSMNRPLMLARSTTITVGLNRSSWARIASSCRLRRAASSRRSLPNAPQGGPHRFEHHLSSTPTRVAGVWRSLFGFPFQKDEGRRERRPSLRRGTTPLRPGADPLLLRHRLFSSLGIGARGRLSA
jgi:hypothetical protein